MESIKYRLLTNWHLMRWIRLITGIAITIHAFNSHDSLLGLVASFLLFQAITDTGCCGANGCDLPNTKNKK